MKTTFIYVLKDPETGAIRYVGKTDQPAQRLSRHLSASKSENHRETWIQQLKNRGLSPVMELIDEVPDNEWPQWEVAYILFYLEFGCELTNATSGGDCGPRRAGAAHYAFGTVRPEATRRKISMSLTGLRHSEPAREKMRVAQAGTNNPNFGKPMSLEQKAKISASLKGKNNPNHGKKFPGRVRSEAANQRTSEAMKSVWANRKTKA